MYLHTSDTTGGVKEWCMVGICTQPYELSGNPNGLVCQELIRLRKGINRIVNLFWAVSLIKVFVCITLLSNSFGLVPIRIIFPK